MYATIRREMPSQELRVGNAEHFACIGVYD